MERSDRSASVVALSAALLAAAPWIVEALSGSPAPSRAEGWCVSHDVNRFALGDASPLLRSACADEAGNWRFHRPEDSRRLVAAGG